MTQQCTVTGDHYDGSDWRPVHHVVTAPDSASEEDKGARLLGGIRTLVRTHPGTRNLRHGEWEPVPEKTIPRPRSRKAEEEQDHDESRTD